MVFHLAFGWSVYAHLKVNFARPMRGAKHMIRGNCSYPRVLRDSPIHVVFSYPREANEKVNRATNSRILFKITVFVAAKYHLS